MGARRVPRQARDTRERDVVANKFDGVGLLVAHRRACASGRSPRAPWVWGCGCCGAAQMAADALDCALDLFRRLPPENVERNLRALVALAPELEADLLSCVDAPLVRRW